MNDLGLTKEEIHILIRALVYIKDWDQELHSKGFKGHKDHPTEIAKNALRETVFKTNVN